MFDAVAAVLTAGAAPEVAVFAFVELLLAFWLLGPGRRTTPTVTSTGDHILNGDSR